MPAENVSAGIFLDTNILIYAFSSDDPRSLPAEELLAAGGTISVQVINEFTNVMRRKLGRTWPDIEAAIAVVFELLGKPLPLTSETHAGAVTIARDHGLSFYDALIVAAAIQAKCTRLLTEDMHHGQKFGDLTIINPFR
jgi:predicted nucleic acid-binding protein